jgi:hypothetical protein
MEVEELILAAALTIEPVLWASSVVGHSMVCGLVFLVFGSPAPPPRDGDGRRR